jgi:hypothetical protein
MKFTLLSLATLFAAASAFSSPSFVLQQQARRTTFIMKMADEDTDFDAPVEARMAVGNIVREGEGLPLDHDPLEDFVDEEGAIDFDAPLAARMAVGDIVRSPE